MSAPYGWPEAKPRALLFVGHGTRSEAGTRMFLEAVHLAVAHLPEEVARQVVIDTAYLELRDPAIPPTLTSLYERGIRHVAVIPMLLFAAGHWKTDIPAQVAEVRRRCPELKVALGPVIGEDERLVHLAAERCRAMAGALQPDDALLVVGRGNRDELATAAFGRVAENIRRALGARIFAMGTLAGFGTPVEAAVRELVAAGPRRIVVLPYLLFEGYLTRTLPQRIVTALADAPTASSIVMVPPLGPHDVIGRVLAERALAAWTQLHDAVVYHATPESINGK